jgi:hypothetical protein
MSNRTWPEFNERGDLPSGIYSANLSQIVTYFGQQTTKRRVLAQRLERLY